MKIKRPSYAPREFRGYALNTAEALDSTSPGFLNFILHAGDLNRQAFFSAATALDLQQPELFLAKIAERAPDVLAGHEHLDPHAQIAWALILLKPQRTLEVVFGACPQGLAGAFSRLGGNPLYPPGLYKAVFDLFSSPANRQRAKVLGQMEGRLSPQHIEVVAALDEHLVHRVVVERAKPVEVQALNTFSQMIQDLCGASPLTIKESLDALPVAGTGANISDWVQGWVARQVRCNVEPPIPSNDPDFRLFVGDELRALGRRYRNCAAQRQAHTLLGDRLVYEWTRPGQPAVLELLRVTSGTETRWVCEDLLAVRNRRVSPEVAASVQAKLSEHGVLYQSLTRLPADEQALHDLLDHNPNRPFWDEQFVAAQEAADETDFLRTLDQLEQEVDQEAA